MRLCFFYMAVGMHPHVHAYRQLHYFNIQGFGQSCLSGLFRSEV